MQRIELPFLHCNARMFSISNKTSKMADDSMSLDTSNNDPNEDRLAEMTDEELAVLVDNCL